MRSASLTFVTIHASDRQTDGRTELRQQYRVLHYMQSHGNNHLVSEICGVVFTFSCTFEIYFTFGQSNEIRSLFSFPFTSVG